jgi:LPS O-antigen subunit length determinant protein (WzzB/FepE family)
MHNLNKKTSTIKSKKEQLKRKIENLEVREKDQYEARIKQL